MSLLGFNVYIQDITLVTRRIFACLIHDCIHSHSRFATSNVKSRIDAMYVKRRYN